MSRQANDQFEAYFTEKIWELIPGFYRDDDGLADNPGMLRAMAAILAGQAAWLRRNTDRLWEDPFITDCDDWAVPYIGDLVATRMVSALDLRGRRVDVAKTIYYRRRKGTLRVLEELISDIAGWEGKATEQFRRVARAQHALDAKPSGLGGLFTNTLPGGYADLRRPRGADLSSGPFDEYFHSADMRRNKGGLDGRFSIPKIAFWLYRVPAVKLTGVMPMADPANSREFTFDPSGRAIALFARRGRDEKFDWDAWQSLAEWETPGPIPCRLLGDSRFLITDAAIAALEALGISSAAATDLGKLDNMALGSEAALRAALATLPSSAELLADPAWTGLLRNALIQNCGKSALLTSFVAPGSGEAKSIRVAVGVIEVESDRIVAGTVKNAAAAALNKDLLIDAEAGGMLFVNAAPAAQVTVDYYYGFPGTIGAGGYDRGAGLLPGTVPTRTGGGAIAASALDPGTGAAGGVTVFGDNSTWTGPSIGPVFNATIEAANLTRPYIRLNGDWTITAAGAPASLTIDGLWIGASGAFKVILAGSFTTVTIRRTTFDPGGVDAFGNAISPVPLVIEGDVEQLTIDHCVMGPIGLAGSGVVDAAVIMDSIVQAVDPAVDLPRTNAQVLRSTIFGAVSFDRLYASEALIAGVATVTDTQDGCFRFSASEAGSRVPHPFESNTIADIPHYFTSRIFGHYGYAQLSESAPDFLTSGAENGSEIGAWSSLLNPILLESLKAKVDEFLPFGLIPIYIFET